MLTDLKNPIYELGTISHCFNDSHSISILL